MSFKYINPGFIAFIGDTSQATEFLGYQYSKTGVAFTQSNRYQSNGARGVYLPDFNSGDDFWAKFDFYMPCRTSGRSYTCCFIPNANTYGIYIDRDGSTVKVEFTYTMGNSHNTLATGSITNGTVESNCGIKLNSINSVQMHVHYGAASSAYADICINNKKNFRSENYNNKAISYNANVFNKQCLFYTYSQTSADDTPISNIILSNEEINIKETIIALPISANETDMTFDSDTGIYTANAANQTLMSAVNTDYLVNEYGSDSAVTGIALIGNPAYKTANGLTSLTAQSKENNVISDIETISLDDDTSAMILASQKISNKTITDLQNVQFGWKAGT